MSAIAYRRQQGTDNLDKGQIAPIEDVYWGDDLVGMVVALGTTGKGKKNFYRLVSRSERYEVNELVGKLRHKHTHATILEALRRAHLTVVKR